MRAYLLLAAGLALASCSATKTLPQYSEAEKAAQRGGISYWQPTPPPATDTGAHYHRRPLWSPADSAIYAKVPRVGPEPVATEKPGLLARLFGKGSTSSPALLSKAEGMPRKCKGCTFNLVAGNQTVAGKKAQVAAGDNATASVVEKKAGPAIVASDSSTLNAVTGGGNLAAVHGDGNTLPQTTTTQQAADWRAVLAKPAGQVGAGLLGLLALGGIGYALYLIFPILRRSKTTDNQYHT